MSTAPTWIGYLAAALLAELLMPFAPIATGVIDAAILVLALSQFGWAQRSPLAIGDISTRLLPAVALLPLLRLLSLTMPVPELPQIAWLALAGAPLLIAIVSVARLTHMDVREFGLARVSRSPRSWSIAALGLPAGFALGWLEPPVIDAGDSALAVLGIAFMLVAFAAIPEELIFRGILQPLMTPAIGRPAILVTALASGISYAGSGSVAVIALMIVIGLIFSWEVAETGSVWVPLVGHSLLVMTAVLLVPRLISA